jgi:predicted TIM-barrel fold metal-dependent hydrolase
MDFALEELRRISKISCFRAAFIRPLFVEGRYFTHPYYDPLWSELESLGVTAAVHSTPGLWNPEWTSHGPFIEKLKGRLVQTPGFAAGGGPTAGGGPPGGVGGGGLASVTGLPLGHALSPILSHWLDNYLFVASTMLGYTVIQRYPKMKMVVAHGKASWMEEILEKFESSTRTTVLQHYYPVRTDPERLWEESQVMLGFDADEIGVPRLPEAYEGKVVWGSRYPNQDTTSAWDAIQVLTKASVGESTIARMLGRNAAQQYGINLVQKVGS